MKTGPLLLAVFSVAATSFGQLRISHFDRAGNIGWTNELCGDNPVYRILSSRQVDDAFSHVTFVTNKTSVNINSYLNGRSTPLFFRVQYYQDTPLEFDYAFTDGTFGLTTITGTLSVHLTGGLSAGTRSFAPTENYIENEHPIGDGLLYNGSYIHVGLLRVHLKPWAFDDGLFLQGFLSTGVHEGKCVYTEYSGTVERITIAGGGAIGSFVATRRGL